MNRRKEVLCDGDQQEDLAKEIVAPQITGWGYSMNTMKSLWSCEFDEEAQLQQRVSYL